MHLSVAIGWAVVSMAVHIFSCTNRTYSWASCFPSAWNSNSRFMFLRMSNNSQTSSQLPGVVRNKLNNRLRWPARPDSSAERTFLPSTMCARMVKELFEHNGNAAVLLVRATTLGWNGLPSQSGSFDNSWKMYSFQVCCWHCLFF